MRPGTTLSALLLSLISCLLLSAAPAARAQGPQGAPPPPEVGVVTIQPRDITVTTELPGRVTPHQVAEVRPQVGGIILERAFQEGARVAAGQLLYRIDPALYQATLEMARATLARDEAILANARLKVTRYQELVGVNAVSREDNDNAQAAMKEAEATVQMDHAAVETARINLERTRVTAPISGVIGRSNVTQGALVTANQAQPLATIRQLDPIHVDLTRASADLSRQRQALAAGALHTPQEADAARVTVVLEDGTPYAHPGRLQFAEVNVDEATGSVILRAEVPNPEGILLPGMYVRATVVDGIRRGGILAPQQGVGRDPRGHATALVLGDDGTVQQRQLTIDRAVGNHWLVTGGLAAGDRLIVDGVQRVRPGAAARPAPPVRDPAGSAHTDGR